MERESPPPPAFTLKKKERVCPSMPGPPEGSSISSVPRTRQRLCRAPAGAVSGASPAASTRDPHPSETLPFAGGQREARRGPGPAKPRTEARPRGGGSSAGTQRGAPGRRAPLQHPRAAQRPCEPGQPAALLSWQLPPLRAFPGLVSLPKGHLTPRGQPPIPGQGSRQGSREPSLCSRRTEPHRRRARPYLLLPAVRSAPGMFLI